MLSQNERGMHQEKTLPMAGTIRGGSTSFPFNRKAPSPEAPSEFYELPAGATRHFKAVSRAAPPEIPA